jgi:Domain of unknown function (DUF4145)
MVRRTLEGVCADHDVKGSSLYDTLGKMKSQGLIDGRLFDWAQELRVLGNEGAHYTGKSVSEQDAADALSLAEALMDYLYVLSAKFDEFRERRRAERFGGSAFGLCADDGTTADEGASASAGRRIGLPGWCGSALIEPQALYPQPLRVLVSGGAGRLGEAARPTPADAWSAGSREQTTGACGGRGVPPRTLLNIMCIIGVNKWPP